MKKNILFLFVLFQCGFTQAQTTVYHSFPNDSAVWNVSYQDYWNYDCRNYSYSIIGDTIINSTTYHKIWEQGESFLMKDIPPQPIPTCTNQILGTYSRYSGAIRENISQRKIYFLPPTYTVESLLYDFTLNVGDTIKGYFNTYAPIVIQSIDSILIGSQYRKRWNIPPMCGWGGPAPRIIEGIGSVFGLLELPCGIEKNSRTLECFSQNNRTLYPNYDATTGCVILTTVIEKEDIKNISIFPNPSNGKFQLTLNNLKLNTFEITDVLGNIILRSEIKNETTEIDLSDRSTGIYFVRISNSKGNFVVKKIVKQ
jgi:hypothetical protein